jgi:hypothetical protein
VRLNEPEPVQLMLFRFLEVPKHNLIQKVNLDLGPFIFAIGDFKPRFNVIHQRNQNLQVYHFFIICQNAIPDHLFNQIECFKEQDRLV